MNVAAPRPLSAASPPFLALYRRPVIVSAKLHRQSGRRASPEETTRGVGLAVLTAVKSDRLEGSEQREHPSDSTTTKNSIGDERSLSGSDILLALQKAAARKGRKRSRGKPKGMAGETTDEGENVADYSNVRPINIRKDWADRLDELDKALRELQELEA